uniref:Putative secreted protein n=1 Tax=Ixodes ricinus TaxID=34613 RepID=A0A6B0TZY2_IXORI
MRVWVALISVGNLVGVHTFGSVFFSRRVLLCRGQCVWHNRKHLKMTVLNFALWCCLDAIGFSQAASILPLRLSGIS